jgi:hypothetical protein
MQFHPVQTSFSMVKIHVGNTVDKGDRPYLDRLSPLTPTEHDAPQHGDVSFEDLAQQVEEKYRWLEM